MVLSSREPMEPMLVVVIAAATLVDQIAAQSNSQLGHTHAHQTCADTATGGIVNEMDQALITEVTQMSTSTHGVPGYATFQIVLHLQGTAQNVYTIYGDDRPLTFPAAYQVESPFGSDIGPVDPQLWPYSTGGMAEFDSWLDIGPVSSTAAPTTPSTIGIAFRDKCQPYTSITNIWSADCTGADQCDARYATAQTCRDNGYQWQGGWSESSGLESYRIPCPC